MSRKLDNWNNKVAESFFATLNNELVHHKKLATRQQAAPAIIELIEVFYNRVRPHSYLGYMTLREYHPSNTAAT